MHIGLLVLKAKIRGFQLAGVSIRQMIARASGDRKSQLWAEKRLLGAYCREHLVAYGLLRGRDYLSIEKSSPNNQLNVEEVHNLIVEHGGYQLIPKGVCSLSHTRYLLERHLTAHSGPVPETVSMIPTEPTTTSIVRKIINRCLGSSTSP